MQRAMPTFRVPVAQRSNANDGDRQPLVDKRQRAKDSNVALGIGCLAFLFIGTFVTLAVWFAVRSDHGGNSVKANAMVRAHVAADMLECPLVERPAYDASSGGTATMRGAVGMPQLRLVDDGPLRTCTAAAASTRPNPRHISNALFGAPLPASASPSTLTGLTWSFGQFIDHTIVLTRTRAASTECPALRIALANDPTFRGEAIEMDPTAFEYDATRDDYRPPAGISAFVDASSVYGSTAARAYHLRTFVDGLLRVEHDDHWSREAETLPRNTAGLENVGGDTNVDMFLAGDIRSSEQAPLAAWHTVWVREHNYQARRLRATPEFAAANDECLFQAARRIVRGELQRATFDDFVAALSGGRALPAYKGYRADVDPRASIEFAGAAYRMGHSMVTDTIARASPTDGTSLAPFELRRAFKRPDALLVECGVDELLAGALLTRSEPIDARVVDALRQHLFVDEGRELDLVAINIERGREHGIASFGRLRQFVAANLSFSEDGAWPTTFTARYAGDAAIIANLYGTNDVVVMTTLDAYVGLLAEAPARAGAPLGRTLEAIVRDQFARMRDGDPLYYRHSGDAATIRYVDSNDGSLRAILARTTRIAPSLMRSANIFVAAAAA